MSKEAFLTELAGHLKVLEEREQQDILDEYAQHIDMKIQNGMSEEEAIGDFGPVKELAAEILEAYHVNPEYGDSSRRVKMDFESAAQSAEQGIRQAGGFLKKAGKKLVQWIQEVCAWIGKPFHKKPAGKPVEQPDGTVDLLTALHADEVIKREDEDRAENPDTETDVPVTTAGEKADTHKDDDKPDDNGDGYTPLFGGR